MTVTIQSEFPLRVAVCAWCQPKDRSADPAKSAGSLSHGICPRHLKKLKLEMQLQKNGGNFAPAAPTHSRRRQAAFNHPELNYRLEAAGTGQHSRM